MIRMSLAARITSPEGVVDRPIHTVDRPIHGQEYRIADTPFLVIVKAPGPG